MTLRKFTDGGVPCGGLNQQNIGFNVGRCSFSLLHPSVKVFCRQGHNHCQMLTVLSILTAMTKIPNSKGQPSCQENTTAAFTFVPVRLTSQFNVSTIPAI